MSQRSFSGASRMELSKPLTVHRELEKHPRTAADGLILQFGGHDSVRGCP